MLIIQFFFVVTTLFKGTLASSRNPEVQLIKHLFGEHDANGLPRIDTEKPVTVKYSIALKQIVDVNEKEQILVSNLWIRHYWSDPYLQWNPTMWGNVKTLALSPDMLWVPDIALYNNANDDFQGFHDYGKTKVNVFSDGDVQWLVPVIIRSECKMNMDQFPFDTQICLLEFGSWVYDGASVDLQKATEDIDMTSFSESSEFVVTSGKVERVVTKYACCENAYVTIIYNITLERRRAHYLVNLVLPGVIIAVLTCFTFLLPPGSGERTGLIITNMLALSVYVLIASEQIPPNPGGIPLLVSFYTKLIIEIAVALVINIIVIPIAIWNTPMPRMVKKIFLEFLGPYILCSGKCKTNCDDFEKEDEEKVVIDSQRNAFEVYQTNGNVNWAMSNNEISGKVNTKTEFEETIIKHIQEIAEIMKGNEEAECNNEDWDALVQILDRLFFILFFLIIFLSSLVVLLT